jgi:hypothetical protein
MVSIVSWPGSKYPPGPGREHTWRTGRNRGESRGRPKLPVKFCSPRAPGTLAMLFLACPFGRGGLAAESWSVILSTSLIVAINTGPNADRTAACHVKSRSATKLAEDRLTQWVPRKWRPCAWPAACMACPQLLAWLDVHDAFIRCSSCVISLVSLPGCPLPLVSPCPPCCQQPPAARDMFALVRVHEFGACVTVDMRCASSCPALLSETLLGSAVVLNWVCASYGRDRLLRLA